MMTLLIIALVLAGTVIEHNAMPTCTAPSAAVTYDMR